MKTGLDSLKDALPQIKQSVARTWTTSEVTRGWNEVADQFSLFSFKVRHTNLLLTNRYGNVLLTPCFCTDNAICDGLRPLPASGRGYDRTTLLWGLPSASGEIKGLMI